MRCFTLCFAIIIAAVNARAADAPAAPAVPASAQEIGEAIALARSLKPKKALEPGVYKTVSTKTKMGDIYTTTQHFWVRADAPTLRREDEAVTSAKNLERVRWTTVIIYDEEGQWFIFPKAKAAVMGPSRPTIDFEKSPMGVLMKEIADAPPEKRKEVMAKYFQFTGETCVVEGHKGVRVIRTLTPEMRKIMEKQTLAFMDEQKKQMPLAMRIAMKFVSMKKAMEAGMPVKTVTTIDVETRAVVSEQTLNAKGEVLSDSAKSKAAPELCADYDTKNFQIPEDYARYRAKTLSEMLKLNSDFRKKEGQIKKDENTNGSAEHGNTGSRG